MSPGDVPFHVVRVWLCASDGLLTILYYTLSFFRDELSNCSSHDPKRFTLHHTKPTQPLS